MCRGGSTPCILDAPQFTDWLASGRAGDDPQQSFKVANDSFTAGLRWRDEDSEMCAHGHTDHQHTNASAAAECRGTIREDTCADRPAGFVCACVSRSVAFIAQDEMGADQRFNLISAAFFCIGTATVMLLCQLVTCFRAYIGRHCVSVRRDALRRVRQLDDEEGSPHRQRLANATQKSGATAAAAGDLRDLTRCAASCTLVVALVGGPLLLLAALPKEYGYWTGCGFRIPYVIPENSGRLVANG